MRTISLVLLGLVVAAIHQADAAGRGGKKICNEEADSSDPTTFQAIEDCALKAIGAFTAPTESDIVTAGKDCLNSVMKSATGCEGKSKLFQGLQKKLGGIASKVKDVLGDPTKLASKLKGGFDKIVNSAKSGLSGVMGKLG